MNGKEQGFLLLTSRLGDPQRKPLTAAQLRTLAVRIKNMEKPDTDRELTADDLCAIGYDREGAERIVRLMNDQPLLGWYLQRGARQDCVPVTRISAAYPDVLRDRLGLDCPGCLWAKGDTSMLQMPAVALVGSRELEEKHRNFASEVGKQAALQGFVLISGNARGADRTAQEACLAYGGNVISVVADALQKQPLQENVLYLSEDGYDLPFSPQRALSRNRIIHCLPKLVLIARCTLGKGGTWDGTLKNLRHNWNPVFCFDDGSQVCRELEQMGAVMVGMDGLHDLRRMQGDLLNFL